MENENVKQMVTEIRENLSQHSISLKDEGKVMKAMINDMNYNVVTYGNEGANGTFCPAQTARDLAASIINGAADIPKQEAASLASNYEFTKQDAGKLVDLSKEFVNTYTDTERKLSFGGRETYEMAILKQQVSEAEKSYPRKVLDSNNNPVIGADGKPQFEFPTKTVPAHTGAKMFAGCPSWMYR